MFLGTTFYTSKFNFFSEVTSGMLMWIFKEIVFEQMIQPLIHKDASFFSFLNKIMVLHFWQKR